MKNGMFVTRLSAAALVAGCLALSGCGGGSGTAMDPGTAMQTPAAAAGEAVEAADTAVRMVMDGSGDGTVANAERKLAAAQAAFDRTPPSERGDLGRQLAALRTALAGRKESRTAAMAEAARMAAAAAERLREGIAFRDSAPGEGRRHAVFSDRNMEITVYNRDTAGLLVSMGGETATLRLAGDAVVDSLGGGGHLDGTHSRGWKGSRYELAPDGGGTYTAMVWTGDRPGLGRSLNEIHDYLAKEGWIRQANLGGGNIDDEGFGFEGSLALLRPEDGEFSVSFEGRYYGLPGTYRCVPQQGSACAARRTNTSSAGALFPGIELGGTRVGTQAVFEQDAASWAFRPDDPDAPLPNMDRTQPVYGWWLHESESGELTASVFSSFRGGTESGGNQRTGDNDNIRANWRDGSITSGRLTFGTASYTGGAAGLYALGAESGEFTATARLTADFGVGTRDRAATAVPPGGVTGVVDGFMVRGLDSDGDREARDWKVELTRMDIGEGAASVREFALSDPLADGAGRTKWFLDGGDPSSAGAPGGEWSGEFREWNDRITAPAHLTGAFLSERDGGRMAGAFGADSARVVRPHDPPE